ncbi:MAG: hypothetical protein E6J40_11690 [Chloroflexi bacterium]|nr:MAG: hypothetical protein E6J40_11690 [Chloroflexota bacterium]
MASSTRTKAPQRGAKGKTGRRLPPKVKTGPDIPMLPVAVGAILVAFAIGLIVYNFVNNRAAPTPKVAGVTCDHLEQTQTHYHAALQIIHEGDQVRLPGGIGIQGGESTPTCYYWLHVHTAYPDIIHIESPLNDTFTLGQFFQVWDQWSKDSGKGSVPFDATHVSSFTLGPDQKIYVYVDASDGKGAVLYSGDPKSIVLKAHEVITIEITKDKPTPPPAFDWDSGTNKGL